MRKINVERGIMDIANSLIGYLKQLNHEINELYRMTNKEIYLEALAKLNKFMEKYPSIYEVSSKINEELASPYSVEYCLKNGKFPEDASPTSIEFESSINEIFKIEDLLKKEAISSWETGLSKLENIENGESFIAVGHASFQLPGLENCGVKKEGQYNKLYLSCSLLSDKELNTFDGCKTVYLVNVDESNYIASSSYDTVTADISYTTFETLKEIDIDGNKHYIKVGYLDDSTKGVTTIATPELIEKDSIKREIAQMKEMYKYDCLTNEIVLDRTKTSCYGALLVSDGHDILIENYLILKRSNIPFKCINRSLYREQNGLVPYEEGAIEKLFMSLASVDDYIRDGYITKEELADYYKTVVIPMKYTKEAKDLIDNKFSQYIDINELTIHNITSK